MNAVATPQPGPLDIDKLAKAFVRIRDARAEAKREWEDGDNKLKMKQERLMVAMLQFLQQHNVDRMGTEHGTVYRLEEIKPSCTDWNALYEWIAENDAFDCLEKRVKTGFIKEYMEQHNGERPPGVQVHREYVVRVRRS